MTTALLSQVLVNGLMLALIYILTASGLTLIFSIMGIINFAHGEFYMLGAYALFVFLEILHLNFFASILASMIILFFFGLLIERCVYRPFRDKHLTALVVSLGLAILIQHVTMVVKMRIWGLDDQAASSPLTGVFRVGGTIFSKERLLTVIMSAIVILLLHLFIQKTKSGQAMRAVAQDRDAALLQGIDTNRIGNLAFGVGTALAAAAGAFIGPIFTIEPFMGGMPVMKAFVVIILGGLGSIPGAMLGGLILGFTESFVATFMGSISDMFGFIILVLILIFRPAGLLGHEH